MFKRQIYKIYQALLNLFFPVECLGCQREGVYLCDNCYQKIPLLAQADLPKLENVDMVIAAASYHNKIVEQSIHCLKFKFITGLSPLLAKLLIKAYLKTSPTPDCPLVIPVPLHKKRLLERGFNQSELMAKNFAEYFGYQLTTDLIERIKNTPHQVGLDKQQRQKNITKAFTVKDPELVSNRDVIIIDDVLTTGATVSEIARQLKQKGARQILILTVAYEN